MLSVTVSRFTDVSAVLASSKLPVPGSIGLPREGTLEKYRSMSPLAFAESKFSGDHQRRVGGVATTWRRSLLRRAQCRGAEILREPMTAWW